MNRISFFILFFITLLFVITSVFLITNESSDKYKMDSRKLAFPKLSKNINNVKKIEIVFKNENFSIEYKNKNWVVLEKESYTVPRKKVRDFLVELSSLKLIEKKTSKFNRYKRLHLDSPNNESSESRKIKLISNDGEILAHALIGKRKYFLYVDGRGGTYIRKINEKQSWLSEGEVNFSGIDTDWLDKLIFDFDPNDVMQYKIIYPDLSELTAYRNRPGQKFKLNNFKNEIEFRTDNELERLSFVIDKFEFADIEKFPFNNLITNSVSKHIASYTFFDGLKITFEVFTMEKKADSSKFDDPPRWAKVYASISSLATLEQRNRLGSIVNDLNKKMSPWEFLLDELDSMRTTKQLKDMIK